MDWRDIVTAAVTTLTVVTMAYLMGHDHGYQKRVYEEIRELTRHIGAKDEDES